MRQWMLAISLGLVSAVCAQGQSTRPEALPADRMLTEMLKHGSEVTTRPSTRPQSVVMQGRGASKLKLVREGTEIYNRPGHLHKRDDGLGQDFVFDDDGSATPIANMIVLADLKLMSMENAQATTDRDLHFNASGVVTEYKDRNYLLLESSSDDISRRPAVIMPKAISGKPPSADAMLKDMLGGAPKPPLIPSMPTGPMTDSTSGAGAVAPGAPVLTVMREGSQIPDRIGRLTHSNDGQQAEFTFESDGSTMQDPPLIILPNLKLGTMEASVQSTNKDLLFRVTGTVTEYRGRNYILLQKVVVVSDLTRQF